MLKLQLQHQTNTVACLSISAYNECIRLAYWARFWRFKKSVIYFKYFDTAQLSVDLFANLDLFSERQTILKCFCRLKWSTKLLWFHWVTHQMTTIIPKSVLLLTVPTIPICCFLSCQTHHWCHFRAHLILKVISAMTSFQNSTLSLLLAYRVTKMTRKLWYFPQTMRTTLVMSE